MRGNLGLLRDFFVFFDEFNGDVLLFYYLGLILFLVLILFSDISEFDSFVIMVN